MWSYKLWMKFVRSEIEIYYALFKNQNDVKVSSPPPLCLSPPNTSNKKFEIAILLKIVLNSNFYNLVLEKSSIAPSERIITYVSWPLLEYKFFCRRGGRINFGGSSFKWKFFFKSQKWSMGNQPTSHFPEAHLVKILR